MPQHDVLGQAWAFPRDRRRHRRAAALARTVVPRIALIALGVVLAAVVGTQAVGGWSRELLLFVVGISAAIVLFILAYTRFATFVIVILVLRASVDWTKTPTEVGQPIRSGGMTTGLAVVFIGAAVAWLLVQYRSGHLVRPALLSIAWVAFLVASIVSAATSHMPLESLTEAGRIAAAVTMLVVLDQFLRSGAYIRPVLAACYASALVPLTVAARQAVTAGATTAADGTGRVYGTFAHPNALGFYLAILIVMGVALLPHLSGRVRLLLLLFVSTAALMVVLTYSRGSWAALLVGLIAVSLLQAPRLVLLILGIAAVVALTVPSVTARLDLRSEQNVAGIEGDSLQWRFDYWRTIGGLADERPLFGIGPKMTQYVADQGKVPHNDFLRAYVETGLVGLCAYAAVVLALIHTARGALARGAPGLDRGVAVGFAGCVASFIVFSVAENLMSQVVVLWYFVAFAAAAISVTHRSTPSRVLTTVPEPCPMRT